MERPERFTSPQLLPLRWLVHLRLCSSGARVQVVMKGGDMCDVCIRFNFTTWCVMVVVQY